MRIQNRILRNASGDPTNPDNSAGSGGAGGDDGGASPAPAKPERPADLPEEFWDGEAGSVKIDALVPKLKEYQSLTAGIVQKPEEIDWTLPNDLDPDAKDTVFEVNKDDPMVQALGPVLVGLPQSKISELTAAMARFQLSEAKAAREAIKAEEAKLGEKFMERVTGAQSFIEKALTASGKSATQAKEISQRFRNTWVTAEQVEVIELLAKYAGGPQPARQEGNAGQTENKGRTFYAGMGGGA